MSPEDSKTLERLTSTIIQQVDTMKSMVNTFSDYARPPKINPEATDLNELVRGVVELFKSAHREVKFDLELDDQLLPMPADASRLRQVINNLVKNAIEASAQVAQATISVRTHRFLTDSETYVEIEVSDQGEGINSSLAENIFEPYVTNKTKGTGLGLAIVKKIIEEHGGVVTLENNIGPGAAAIIRLPITGVGDTLTLQVEKSDGKIG